MIDRLRKRMICISAIAFMAVFALIFSLICAISMRQLNSTMDMLCDRISEGGGVFLPFDKNNPRPPDMERFPGFFTDETPFSTRFFVVRFDSYGNVVSENTESVSTVSDDEARDYARKIWDKGASRGWEGNYRYKLSTTHYGSSLIFVDGSTNRATTRNLLITSGCVLVGSLTVVLLVVILVSKRAVRPMAESYEKQKQFVTDANHELKTPLTLILTNLDILESETGKNEWLDDIRAEGRRMSELVGELTALSRLDEIDREPDFLPLSLSDMAADAASEFAPLAQRRGLRLRCDIQEGLTYTGDEAQLRRMLGILLDNAVKYCDDGGEIFMSLWSKRSPVISVENTFARVDSIELHRLFDRFYRADKARTAGSSFGIGLSIAQAIARRHHGEASAYKAGHGRIGFEIRLK